MYILSSLDIVNFSESDWLLLESVVANRFGQTARSSDKTVTPSPKKCSDHDVSVSSPVASLPPPDTSRNDYAHHSDGTFQYVLLSEHARVPTRATDGAVGYDVRSPYATYIGPGCTNCIDLHLAIKPPPGMYARTACRSGLASRHSLFCPADVIDPDYTGSIHMCVSNLSSFGYHVEQYEKVGSIVFERYGTPVAEEVDRLEETGRGAKGFGSTGRV